VSQDQALHSIKNLQKVVLTAGEALTDRDHAAGSWRMHIDPLLDFIQQRLHDQKPLLPIEIERLRFIVV